MCVHINSHRFCMLLYAYYINHIQVDTSSIYIYTYNILQLCNLDLHITPLSAGISGGWDHRDALLLRPVEDHLSGEPPPWKRRCLDVLGPKYPEINLEMFDVFK